jgi:tripartite-type tricarboxylate transporter receptor subunit TctC
MSLLIASFAAAQAFPNKTVSIMVPYPAGGLSDIIARQVAQPFSKAIGQTVIVENLGGVSGAIGAQKVLSAPSDGYFVFQGSPNEVILAPLANAAVKFKPDDFRLVQMIGVAPITIMARKALPANNVDELILYARKMAAEGKPLTYGSVGYGSFYHVLGAHFSKTIGAAMTHVPYKGGPPLMQDLAGDQVDLTILATGASFLQMVDTNKIKMIGTLAPAGKVEVPLLKPYPSINDSKLIKNFAFNIWTGYFVKKDTPEAIVQSLNKSLGATLGDPAMRESL